MERQRIKEEIGALEERLELLDLATNAHDTLTPDARQELHADFMVREALASLRRLQGLVQEEKLERSLDTEDFLRRVSGLLVREASEAGLDIAISTYGSGRISLEMVEISMGAILACLRASLKSFKGMGRAIRVKHQLFYTYSIHLEVRANPDEVQFRLADDGQGYNGSFRTEFETEHQFRRIRTHISKYGGWFRRRTRPDYGGTIEFKAALPMSRFECLSLGSGEVEILLPQGCVAEVAQALPAGGKIAYLDEAAGLTTAAPKAIPVGAVRVAVADFQFWIAYSSLLPATRARRLSADGLVDRGAWFKSFGVYHQGGIPKVLPLLDGEALMNFHVSSWGSDEGI